MVKPVLLNIYEVAELTGMARSSVHYRVGKGDFPRPVVERPRAHFWSEAQVKAYLAGQDWLAVPVGVVVPNEAPGAGHAAVAS